MQREIIPDNSQEGRKKQKAPYREWKSRANLYTLNVEHGRFPITESSPGLLHSREWRVPRLKFAHQLIARSYSASGPPSTLHVSTRK